METTYLEILKLVRNRLIEESVGPNAAYFVRLAGVLTREVNQVNGHLV
jgi:hypothetical protein